MNKEELREKRNRTIETLDDIKAVLGLDELYIDEFEKENAELKELLDCKNCCELEESECESCAEFGHFRCKGKAQLTKAKEILKAVVDFYPTMTATILLEAEQFLNSEVEK